jgi:hypothetical protein
MNSTTIEIDDKQYTLQKQGKQNIWELKLNIINTERRCFIIYSVNTDNSIFIELFRCDSEISGTGRTTMKDLLTHISIQPTFNMETIISIVPDANYFTRINERIVKTNPDSNNTKLQAYYEKIGFDKTEDKEGYTLCSGTIGNIIDKITSYKKGGKRKTKKNRRKIRKHKLTATKQNHIRCL